MNEWMLEQMLTKDLYTDLAEHADRLVDACSARPIDIDAARMAALSMKAIENELKNRGEM